MRGKKILAAPLQISILVLAVVLPAADEATGQEFIGPHGYLTFEAEVSNRDSVGWHGTFRLHHFNLFGNYLLGARARVFGEIEFEYGADTGNDEYDNRPAGFIRLERAWFEYAFSEKLKLLLGKFLTPYGIYNEIHDAAPAYDTSLLPQSLYGKHQNPFGDLQRFYPKFSLGVQALGSFGIRSVSLQYQFILVNGRGRQAFEQDDNGDKGLGARFTAELPAAGLKLGYSFYTDKNGLAYHTRQSTHAGDLRGEFNGWRVSVEAAQFRLATGQAQAADRVATACYGELARELLGRQTVLIRYDIFDPDRRRPHDCEKDLTVGTSVQILKQAVAKAEVHWQRRANAPRRNHMLAITSLAVIF
ncbi:MAG: hypothetical protein ONB53_21875 [candidate division KSB1 bacterium]|nr:hypothetical protein [candidate division KSB1 bacterium]MDZ7300448.1 hypothetical protein [candidate division KSB1 bacterium]MDZ7309339.1 hypothetical protein [candidate division KSB1 bacterium]MDZ7351450.1 hypothetical protein [candidate division KSB1 bacterium]MDZ7355809.1 hypothetical protein [candidate division KSB1 bacterium]